MREYGLRPVTVPATTAPASTTIITSPCRLAGWSLTAGLGTGAYAYGESTSPAAGATVATFSTVPAGEYTLNWQTQLEGTVGAGDENNFKVTLAGVQIGESQNPPAAGVTNQEPIQVTVPAGGAILAVKTIAAGTASSIYSATMTLTSGAGAQGVLYDSGQPLGVTAMQQGSADTHITLGSSVYVSTNITLTVLDGTISGVIYVDDDWGRDGRERRE